MSEIISIYIGARAFVMSLLCRIHAPASLSIGYGRRIKICLVLGDLSCQSEIFRRRDSWSSSEYFCAETARAMMISQVFAQGIIPPIRLLRLLSIWDTPKDVSFYVAVKTSFHLCNVSNVSLR